MRKPAKSSPHHRLMGMALPLPAALMIPAQGHAQDVGATIWSDFVSMRLLDLGPWQWLELLAVAIFAYAVSILLIRIMLRIGMSVARASWNISRFDPIVAPARLAAWIVLFYGGTYALQLPDQASAMMTIAFKVLFIISATWILIRLVDIVSGILKRRLEASGNTATITLVPLGRRVIKAFVYILAILSVLQNLGFNISGVLAGLGIGGIAVALAVQKTLENLFGGFVLVADRPVRIGDFCSAGGYLGTVEDIGIRSSKIRTLDRTLVNVPNAELSTASIENYSVRDRIRLHTTLQFGYDTSPDQMRYLLVEIRRMLYAHPRTNPDPCRVRFINFGAHSLDIEIFLYIDTTDWNEFTAIREDIYLRIMDIATASGATFAYPSQTLYLGRDKGRDMTNTARAEASVDEWRNAGALPIPEFPEEMIDEISDSLDYPRAGSSLGGPITT